MKNLKGRKNFFDDQGKFYLVYCYECNKENYSMAVASGTCAWCNWSYEKEIENENL